MQRFICLMTTLCILSGTIVIHAESLESNTGLEVDDHKTLFYVLSLSNHSKMPITEQEVSSQIELRLRALNIRPASFLKRHGKPYLHVIVTLYDRGFNVVLSFRREVSFRVGEKVYRTTADTWSDGTGGTHINDPDFIVRAIIKYLDQFLADYMKANEK